MYFCLATFFLPFSMSLGSIASAARTDVVSFTVSGGSIASSASFMSAPVTDGGLVVCIDDDPDDVGTDLIRGRSISMFCLAVSGGTSIATTLLNDRPNVDPSTCGKPKASDLSFRKGTGSAKGLSKLLS